MKRLLITLVVVSIVLVNVINASAAEEAETVSRSYTLQRYMNACAGRGAYPIKFNGSIFTVDNGMMAG